MKKIYSLKEYCKAFPVNNKFVSERTILRMIENKQLPTRHVAENISNGWVILVYDYSPSELCDTIASVCEKLIRNKPITLPQVVTECMANGIAPNAVRRILSEYLHSETKENKDGNKNLY